MDRPEFEKLDAAGKRVAIAEDVKEAAYKFTHTGRDGKEVLDDEDALAKIWRNVLRNGGTFDPLNEPVMP